jgi:hypothetical protein
MERYGRMSCFHSSRFGILRTMSADTREPLYCVNRPDKISSKKRRSKQTSQYKNCNWNSKICTREQWVTLRKYLKHVIFQAGDCWRVFCLFELLVIAHLIYCKTILKLLLPLRSHQEKVSKNIWSSCQGFVGIVQYGWIIIVARLIYSPGKACWKGYRKHLRMFHSGWSGTDECHAFVEGDTARYPYLLPGLNHAYRMSRQL